MKPAIGWSLAGVGLLGIIVGLGWPQMSCSPQPAEVSESRSIMAQLQIACQQYRTEYGAFPSTAENYRMAEILKSENPRKILFIEFNPRTINANGEIIDGWGTPLRISYLSDDDLLIVSAGKDKLFGSKDDLNNKQ
jgi:hypothetical protein